MMKLRQNLAQKLQTETQTYIEAGICKIGILINKILQSGLIQRAENE